jgi:hypothetical protein
MLLPNMLPKAAQIPKKKTPAKVMYKVVKKPVPLTHCNLILKEITAMLNAIDKNQIFITF